MGCACAIDFDVDHVAAEFVSESRRTARVSHTCTECGRVIKPGEAYEQVFGKWDRHVSLYKTCADCLSLRNALFCGSWYYGMIRETILNELPCNEGLISSDCILQLTLAARDWLLGAIQEYWDNDPDEDEEGGL